MQADMPEAEKNRYIEAYEDAYISRIIEEQIGSYPRDRSREERSAWVHSKVELIEKYKEDHPDYKEQAKQHAIDNAQKAREFANSPICRSAVSADSRHNPRN